MNTCTFTGCQRKPVYPDQSRCEDHRLRWLPSQPVERPIVPEWVRRAQAHQLPAKAVA